MRVQQNWILQQAANIGAVRRVGDAELVIEFGGARQYLGWAALLGRLQQSETEQRLSQTPLSCSRSERDREQ